MHKNQVGRIAVRRGGMCNFTHRPQGRPAAVNAGDIWQPRQNYKCDSDKHDPAFQQCESQTRQQVCAWKGGNRIARIADRIGVLDKVTHKRTKASSAEHKPE